MRNEEKKTEKPNKSRLPAALLLFIVAIVAVAGVTVAWLSIADNTKLHSMVFDITSGTKLRFDFDSHSNFDEYKTTLTFEGIRAQVLKDTGIDIREQSMQPVTTADCRTFTFRDGSEASDGKGHYVRFVLHFMALSDMYVHLTSASSQDGSQAGTLVSSEKPETVNSMRIGFTAEGKRYKVAEDYVAEGDTPEEARKKIADRDAFLMEKSGKGIVFDPGMGDESLKYERIISFGIPTGEKMVYNNTNSLFFLEAGVDTPVTVCIWIEGTDEDCTNYIKASDYTISMRFIGTDGDGNLLN